MAKPMFHGHTAEFQPANKGERVMKIPRCTATAPQRVTRHVRGHRLLRARVISAAGKATAMRGRAPGTWRAEAMKPAAPVRVDHPELKTLFRPDHSHRAVRCHREMRMPLAPTTGKAMRRARET